MCITFEHQNVDRLAAIPVIKKIYRPINLINAMFKYQEGCISNCLYLENHDQLRSVSRFVKPEYSQVGAKAYALFLLTLRGTPFIYQGEEIGMIKEIINKLFELIVYFCKSLSK